MCPTVNSDNNLDWFRCDFKRVNDYLSCINWDIEFLGCDVNQCYFKFISVLFDVFKFTVPVKTDRPTKPPWSRNVSASLQARRSAAWRQFKQLRRQLGRNSPQVLYRVGLHLEILTLCSKVMLSMLCPNMRVILLQVGTLNASMVTFDERK